MSDQEIRIAVAEACGWQWWKHTKSETFLFCFPDRTKDSLDDEQFQWEKCEKPNPKHFVSLAGVPDYPNDLNATSEMVQNFSDQEKESFGIALHGVVVTAELYGLGRHYFDISNATARQRCESFLRVKRLWKE